MDREKVEILVRNALALGRCETLSNIYDEKAYLVHKSNTEHILYMPDDYTIADSAMFNKILSGNVIVIGGSGVKSAEEMFKSARIECLDLSGFDTSNLTLTEAMFCGCIIGEINFKNFNTSEVFNMEAMFYASNIIKGIDISMFDVSNVDITSGFRDLFTLCKTFRINLGNIEITRKIPFSEVLNMFKGCKCTEVSTVDPRIEEALDRLGTRNTYR